MVGRIAFAATALPMAGLAIYGGPAGGKHDDRNERTQLAAGIGLAAGTIALLLAPAVLAGGNASAGAGLLAAGAGVYAGTLGGMVGHELLF